MRFLAALLLGGALCAVASPVFSDTTLHLPQQLDTRDIMHAPSSYGTAPKRSVAYYVNWAIYARGFEVASLNTDQFTHILYSFANVRQTGEVYLSDEWSDIQRKAPTDKEEPGTNMYGNLKQLFLRKQTNRNLKVLLSIGGWTYSTNFAPALDSEAGRQTFADTCVDLVKNYGFDGVDVDYEYPANTDQVAKFVDTLRRTREALAAYAERNGQPKDQFLISLATPAGPARYSLWDFPAIDAQVDFWNLMAYDYAGGTFGESNYTGNMANWFPDGQQPQSTPYNTKQALDYYISHGVAADRIVVGCPLYGRSFSNTTGMGETFSGTVSQGTWEAGVYDWKALPLPGAKVLANKDIMASWSYDDQKHEVISFDDLDTARAKAQMVIDQGLGGLMWWETSADRTGDESMVGTQITLLKEKSGELEQRQNCIDYPESKFDNLRSGFAGS